MVLYNKWIVWLGARVTYFTILQLFSFLSVSFVKYINHIFKFKAPKNVINKNIFNKKNLLTQRKITKKKPDDYLAYSINKKLDKIVRKNFLLCKQLKRKTYSLGGD